MSRGQLGLKWAYAAKDILDHVDFARVNRRHCVAILVGNGGLDSLGRVKLVGGVSQRLVLGNFAQIPRHSEEPAGDEESLFVGNSNREGIRTPFEMTPNGGPISAIYFMARFAPLAPFTLN